MLAHEGKLTTAVIRRRSGLSPLPTALAGKLGSTGIAGPAAGLFESLGAETQPSGTPGTTRSFWDYQTPPGPYPARQREACHFCARSGLDAEDALQQKLAKCLLPSSLRTSGASVKAIPALHAQPLAMVTTSFWIAFFELLARSAVDNVHAASPLT